MRTTKRFTASVIARFVREGRGTGTYEEYLPWHRVGRGDPASGGRSHLLMWRRRQREFLSDVERVGHYFSTMAGGVLDSREQFPLSLHTAPHELSAFDATVDHAIQYPGTLELATDVGIKHFTLKNGDQVEHWRYSTDQLLLIGRLDGPKELLAVAYKPPLSTLGIRERKKLSLEREYWLRRNVSWLLVTPDSYLTDVRRCVERSAPWALGDPASVAQIGAAIETTNATLGLSLTDVLRHLSLRTGSMESAQRAFWQAVWCGVIPLDLRRGWRPHIPVRLLTPEEFAELNPIRSRRSAWN